MKPFHFLMAGLWLVFVLPLQGRPDFTASEIIAERATVVEGEVAHFKVMLRNCGDEPADPVQLRIKGPLMGHLIEVKGAENVQTEPDDGVFTASVPLPVGAERVVELNVLAPQDSGGDALSISVQLIHFHSMAEMWVHQTVHVDTRPRSDGILLAGLRIAPAGVVTLAWLMVTALAIVGVSVIGTRNPGGFFGPRSGVVAVMIAFGFWLIFAVMAWRDYRVLYQWPETTGTIIGRRVQVQSVSSTQRRSTGSGFESGQSDVSKPEFALRYQVDGREMLSTGYDTGSSLRVGGGKKQLEKEFIEWGIGTRVPCWYDPNDPTDVVIKRGFGGAYVFALLPLFPFWMGWSILRRHFSSAP